MTKKSPEKLDKKQPYILVKFRTDDSAQGVFNEVDGYHLLSACFGILKRYCAHYIEHNTDLTLLEMKEKTMDKCKEMVDTIYKEL